MEKLKQSFLKAGRNHVDILETAREDALLGQGPVHMITPLYLTMKEKYVFIKMHALISHIASSSIRKGKVRMFGRPASGRLQGSVGMLKMEDLAIGWFVTFSIRML